MHQRLCGVHCKIVWIIAGWDKGKPNNHRPKCQDIGLGGAFWGSQWSQDDSLLPQMLSQHRDTAYQGELNHSLVILAYNCITSVWLLLSCMIHDPLLSSWKTNWFGLQSEETDQPAGKLNQKFWKETSSIECVQSHIREMIFHEYHGERSELAFLKFTLGNAQVLQRMVILFVEGSLSSGDNAAAKLIKDLLSVKRAGNCRLVISESPIHRGGSRWSSQVASDLDVADPFYCCCWTQHDCMSHGPS